MRYLDRWITWVSKGFAVLSAALLLAATFIITWMVFKRSIGMQNSWELELSIELMIVAVFLGSPYTLATGGHVKMDLLDAVLPKSIGHKVSLVAQLAGCLICFYLGWKGLGMAHHAYVIGERALGVWQPLVWPKYASIPVGMFVTSLQYLVQMHQSCVGYNVAGDKKGPICPN